MTTPVAAFGTFLKIGDGGGTEVFTTIAMVLDIDGPSMSAEVIEATSHSSPGAWREFIPSFLDGGEVSFDVNWIPTAATHNASTGLTRDFKNRTKRNFQIVFPDGGAGTTWAFSAYVTGVSPSAPVGDKLTASFTLKITGQPTLV